MKKAYTLIEVIVTIIVIGIIASLAVPNYIVSVERTKSSEGAQMLEALLNAQRRYYLENNNTYATSIPDLDVEFSAGTNNFADPEVFNNPAELATIKRIGLYILSIDEDGKISCNDDEAPVGTCLKLGY